MKILAITRTGKEYFYKANTARKVSERSADTICTICNNVNWHLKDGEKWHIYDIDKYDIAYEYAQIQSFTIYKGIVKARG